MTRWLLAFLLILTMLLPGQGMAAAQSCTDGVTAVQQAPGEESVSTQAANPLFEEAGKSGDLLDAPELIGPALAAPVLSLPAPAPQRLGLASIPAPAPEGLRRPPRA